MKNKLVLATSFLLLASSSVILAQAIPSGTSSLLVGPGDYSIIDRSKIETAKIEWSSLSQKQDQEFYSKATDESYQAYASLYSSFQKLRLIHIDTIVAKKGTAAVSTTLLSEAINDYIQKRDTFLQKIAAIEVAQDVWKSLSHSKQPDQQLLYSKGLLNLKAFATVYRDAVSKMDDTASKFTYRYKSNMGIAETQAGMGLEIPTANETPESLRAKNADFQDKIKLTSEEIDTIGLMSIEVARHMLSYIDANAQHLYWYNQLQSQDKQEWIESVQTKARVLKWIRSVYCMRLGVPALAIPQPSAFNIGYLTRGVKSEKFRIVQKAEHNEDSIRKTLTRFDEVFTSVQSQSGEFDSVGGFMGFLNRVNSTFTWQNEVHAYMNVMHILRDNMVDELDLIKGPMGCDKVRERYYAQYSSLKDEKFAETASSYLEGLSLGGTADSLQKAFADAGAIITSKGAYMRELKQFLKQHPGTSLISQTLKNADDLK